MVLDSAGAGDQRERLGADRHLVAGLSDPDGRPLGVVLPTDQLERVRDPVDVRDPREGAQVEVVEGVDVTDQPDDGAHHAPGTKASPPTASTLSTTWAICSSVASGDITTTMAPR